jgi:hypothetical protein
MLLLDLSDVHSKMLLQQPYFGKAFVFTDSPLVILLIIHRTPLVNDGKRRLRLPAMAT